MVMSLADLKNYNKWLETTPADVLFSATAAGGWTKVFPVFVPKWASRVRNYFNVLPTTLRRLKESAALALLGSKTGPYLTFQANCHQDQTVNRYKRGKPTPLGPAPPAFKVHAACPVEASHDVKHLGLGASIAVREALSGDVYLDDHQWEWYQMSSGGAIFHYGGKVRLERIEAVYAKAIGQSQVPIFKLIRFDGSGGSCEVILLNYGAGSPGGGSETIGKVDVDLDIYKATVRNPKHQGSYNYADTSQMGFEEHKRMDIKTHEDGTDFYVNPADTHTDLANRRFKPVDQKGRPLATQHSY